MSASFRTTPSLCMPSHTVPNTPSFVILTIIFNSVFLPAADIPRFVALGNVSLGITGQDVILESSLASEITELLPLDFGKCALQVQVPVASPYQSLEELAGKRIVTSFEVLAGELFKGVDEKAQLKEGEKTSVEYIGGSVEAACALGMADGIVDLVGKLFLSIPFGSLF